MNLPSMQADAADSRLNRWLFAVFAALVAMGLRAAMQPLLGDRLPFVFAFPAVVMVALRHGTAPTLLTLGVCGLWALVPWIPPTVLPASMPVEVGSFLISALIITALCAQVRRQVEPVSGAHETALTRWMRTVLWGAAVIPLTGFATAWWGGREKACED